MNTKRRNYLESWFSLLSVGIIVIKTIMAIKNGHYLPSTNQTSLCATEVNFILIELPSHEASEGLIIMKGFSVV